MAGPLRGGQGNAVFVWDGTGTTTVNPGNGGTCFALFDHAVAEWINTDCEATGTGAQCATASSGSVIFLIKTAVTCNPAGTGFVAADPGSRVEFVKVGFNFGNAVGTSPAGMFTVSNYAAIAFDSAETITILGNVSFRNYGVAVFNAGTLQLGGSTFSTGSRTVTGTRFLCSGFSILDAGATPNATLPGSVNGSLGPEALACAGSG